MLSAMSENDNFSTIISFITATTYSQKGFKQLFLCYMMKDAEHKMKLNRIYIYYCMILRNETSTTI